MKRIPKRLKELNASKGYVPTVKDFIEFSRALIYAEGCTDIVYTFLNNYINVMKKANLRGKLMFIHIYHLTYNPSFAIYLFEKYGNAMTWDDIANDIVVRDKKMKIGKYRRGVRMMGLPSAVKTIRDFLNGVDVEEYFLKGLTQDPKENYSILKKRVSAIPQNGLWATHKHIDLLRNVVGINVEFTDWMAKDRRFGGKQFYLDLILERTDMRLRKEYKETKIFIDGVEDFAVKVTELLNESNVSDTHLTLDQSETLACGFHAFYNGKYYLCEDISENYKYYLDSKGVCEKTDAIFLELRKMTFQPEQLEEYTGVKPMYGDRYKIPEV